MDSFPHVVLRPNPTSYDHPQGTKDLVITIDSKN